MCSVIKWSDNGTAIVVARNMDWLENMRSNLWLFPRGINREGLAGKNSLTWAYKYGGMLSIGFHSTMMKAYKTNNMYTLTTNTDHLTRLQEIQ